MSFTARTTIQDALTMLGVLSATETMSAEDASLGLRILNNIVDAWNIEQLYIYTTSVISATFSGKSATIGPGMTINTPRPVSISGCYYKIGVVDYQIQIISIDQYNALPMKDSPGTYPMVMYYTGDSPTGTVYVWPVPPSTNYYLTVNSQLSSFADLDTAYYLPQGYARALLFTLAEEIAPAFQTQAPASVVSAGMKARRMLKRANVSVPILSTNLPDNTASNTQYGKISIITGQ